MSIKLLSLSKNEDFKTLLTGKKISNKYLTIFFKNLSDKSNKNLNISFVTQKKLGNAVKRNRVKRRLKAIMKNISKISKINPPSKKIGLPKPKSKTHIIVKIKKIIEIKKKLLFLAEFN